MVYRGQPRREHRRALQAPPMARAPLLLLPPQQRQLLLLSSLLLGMLTSASLGQAQAGPTTPTPTPTPAVSPANTNVPVAVMLARQKTVDWRCVDPGPRCDVDWNSGIVNLTVDHKTPGMLDSGKTLFLYGTFGIQIRHPPGYSGGTIMAFYLQDMDSTSNKDVRRSEIDVEIYGAVNSSRLVYTTNIFAGGQQNLDQLYLPVDGASKFHYYQIQWGPGQIVYLLDGQPLRILNRDSAHPWPSKPMQVRVSFWDSSSFTTLKADYSKGPVGLQIQGLTATACQVPNSAATATPGSCSAAMAGPWNFPPSPAAVAAMNAVRSTHLIESFGWDEA